jgi:dGTPase
MEWKNLLSAKRWGNEENSKDDRSSFIRDYDRIIFSSPFRRLQNKTQVFPLPGSIFVHNRLTHSLEVASVGRSLANIFYHEKQKRNPGIDRKNPFMAEIGNIVSAACLAHDLGNPAFGHSGEAAISRYFTNGSGQAYENQIKTNQWTDLTHFEGNANALRMLIHPFEGKGNGAFSLTYSTLASIAKYPCASSGGMKPSDVYTKKYGFFQSEQNAFEKIASELGMKKVQDSPLIYKRHPLAYLVEAADDICYQIIDLEDAHRLKILSYKEIKQLLWPFCVSTVIKKNKETEAILKATTDTDAKVSFLRAKSISRLTVSCAAIFLDKENLILRGEYNKALTEDLEPGLQKAWNIIARLSKEKIYNYPSVVEKEVAGYKVMEGLLEVFIPALINNDTHYYKKIVNLIPPQFKSTSTDTYSKIQSILDFVSGMTDLYAVELFRTIKGISFPSLH